MRRPASICKANGTNKAFARAFAKAFAEAFANAFRNGVAACAVDACPQRGSCEIGSLATFPLRRPFREERGQALLFVFGLAQCALSEFFER